MHFYALFVFFSVDICCRMEKPRGGGNIEKGEFKLLTPLLQDRQSGGIEYRKGEMTSDTTVTGRKMGRR